MNIDALIEAEGDEWRAENMVALRHNYSLHWCGYIAIPPGHPWHGKHYDADELIDVSVHGGLTYAEDHEPRTEPDVNWWVGFDCAHLGDLSPGFTSIGEETYRTLEYVKDQLRALMRQAIEARRAVEIEA